MLYLLYPTMFVFVLETNIENIIFVFPDNVFVYARNKAKTCYVSFVLHFNAFIYAKNKSSVNYICFTLQWLCLCFCFTLQCFCVFPYTRFFYPIVFMFMLEINLVGASFFLP